MLLLCPICVDSSWLFLFGGAGVFSFCTCVCVCVGESEQEADLRASVLSLFLTALQCVLFSVCASTPYLPLQYLTFVLQVLNRSFLYGGNAAFISVAWVYSQTKVIQYVPEKGSTWKHTYTHMLPHSRTKQLDNQTNRITLCFLLHFIYLLCLSIPISQLTNILQNNKLWQKQKNQYKCVTAENVFISYKFY